MEWFIMQTRGWGVDAAKGRRQTRKPSRAAYLIWQIVRALPQPVYAKTADARLDGGYMSDFPAAAYMIFNEASREQALSGGREEYFFK